MDRPIITRQKLQDVTADAVAYGAKDTGGMGGGAATGVITTAGPAVRAALVERLPFTTRRVGDVVVTESFGLAARGVRWVCHVISIIAHTPQGAYCPEPNRLTDGVYEALRRIDRLGGTSVAFAALGTGEGRVKPANAARLMVAGVKRFHRDHAESPLTVIFALPSERDYRAFIAELRAW